MPIDKRGSFAALARGWRGATPEGLFSVAMAQLDDLERARDPTVSGGALSNAHGDWYEWLLGTVAWNLRAMDASLGRALLLPNVSQFDVIDLYQPQLRDLLRNLRATAGESGVELITSNPDFVILHPDLAPANPEVFDQLAEITPAELDRLTSAYREFAGICGFSDIIGFVSVKFTLRPDRRLQLPHEGSLWKALYSHLRTRLWIVNPPGLRYYAIASAVTDPDRRALRTAATHTLTTVSERPVKAVDELFVANSTAEATEVWRQILTI